MDINELRDRVLTLPTLENKHAQLQNEIREAEKERSELLRQLERENRDVERLKEASLSAFLFKLVGKYEDKFEKEQQEEISAKLAYDRARTRLESLMREKETLTSRISDLRAEKMTYQAELEKRRSSIAGRLTEPEGIAFIELENERRAIIEQITEIREAQSAASRAASTAQSALSSLEKAQRWATYDVLSDGGIISHVAKYSNIDSAEQDLNLLSSQLRKMKSELRDVHGLTEPRLGEISSVQRTVDFWFDNIFTDLSVRGKIKNNAEEIRSLLRNIQSVEAKLSSKLKSENSKLSENRRREEELLVAFRMD